MSGESKEYTEFLGFKSLFLFCSLPLRLDSYRGCSFGCRYCLSMSLNNRSHDFRKTIVPASPKRLNSFIEEAMKPEHTPGPVASCIRRGVPFHFGCTSDPLQPAEVKHGVTLGFLRVLQDRRYPFYLCTKSDLVAKEPYANILRDSPCSIQFSFSTMSPSIARRIEPTAPTPLRRLRALESLANRGVHVVARLQPFLYPAERLSEGLFETLANAGVRHVVLEHLRIPTNSRLAARKRLWDSIGMDLLAEYRRLGLKRSRISYELASEHKVENVIFAKQEANRRGMTFGSGDNDFHHVSDHLCCCGVPDDPAFAHFYDGHLLRGIVDGMCTGHISYDYLQQVWHPQGSIREYVNSDCRLCGENTVCAFLQDRIQTPGRTNSPETFYGVERSVNGEFVFEEKKIQSIKEATKHVVFEKTR